MEVFRAEIRSGILILVSLAVLVVGIFLVSDLKDLLEEKKELTVLFTYADGISRGSPVWYAGVEVGEVTKVSIAPQRPDRVALTLRIDPRARVTKDSKVYIRSLGMMGAKYVDISPGSPEGESLKPGEVLEGEAPVSLSEIMERGYTIARQLEGLLGELQDLAKGIKDEGGLARPIRNASIFLGELRERNKDLERILKKVEGLLASSQASLEKLSISMEQVAKNTNRILGEGGVELVALLQEARKTNESLRLKLDGVYEHLSGVLVRAEQGATEATSLIKDARALLDENDQNLYLLLLHLEEASRHLEALSQDLRAHPWKVLWRSDGDMSFVEKKEGPHDWRSKGRIGRLGKE